MNEFDKLELNTETLRELSKDQLSAVAGGAKPVSEVNCRPWTWDCESWDCGGTLLCATGLCA